MAGPGSESGSLQSPCKLRARSPDEQGDGIAIPHNGKRLRVEDATSRQQSLNHRGSGGFELNEQRGMAKKASGNVALASYQAFLRQHERDQRFRELKEREIKKRLDEEYSWISKEASLHEQRLRSLPKPGEASQDRDIEQCANQDPGTPLALEPVNGEVVSVADSHERIGLPVQELPRQDLLQREYQAPQQEVEREQDEEEVVRLLEWKEHQVLETVPTGLATFEQDPMDLDLSGSEQRIAVGEGQVPDREPGFHDLEGETWENNDAACVPPEGDKLVTLEASTPLEHDGEASRQSLEHEVVADWREPASQAGPGLDGSCDELRQPELAKEAITTSGLSPQLEAWVSSQVNNARTQARNKAKKLEEERLRLEVEARQGMEKYLRQQAKPLSSKMYHERLDTWPGTRESLEEAVWKALDQNIEKNLDEFDEKATENAQQRQAKYQDEEDAIARAATEAALSQINKGKQSISRPTSSCIEALQQEKSRAEEAWLEYETASTVQNNAARRASQMLRRRQTMELKKNGVSSVEPVKKGKGKGKGKARDMTQETSDQPASHSTTKAPAKPVSASYSAANSPTAAQVPYGRHSPPLSKAQETSDPSASRHTTTAPVKPVSASYSVANSPTAAPVPRGQHSPPLSKARETYDPSASRHTTAAPVEPVLSSSSAQCPPAAQAAQVPSGWHSPLLSKTRETSDPSASCQMTTVPVGPVSASSSATNSPSAAQVPSSHFPPPLQTRESSDSPAPHRTTTAPAHVSVSSSTTNSPSTAQVPSVQHSPLPSKTCETSDPSILRHTTAASVEPVFNCGDGGFIGAASQQLPPVDSAPGHLQTDRDLLLSQLLEHARTSEETINLMACQARTSDETITHMAHEMAELKQALVLMIQRGVAQGANPSTLTSPSTMTPPPSTSAGPPTIAPPPSLLRARRIGPPGTFRNPVPPPLHKSASTNDFHSKCRELIRELLHGGARNIWPTPPTEAELKQFKMSRSPADGPTQDDFRLDFSTQPLHTSIWNLQAADIFAEVYLSSDYPRQPLDKVKEEFVKRLTRLHQRYRTFLQTKDRESSDEDETPRRGASMKRQRRRRRELTLFESRLTAIRSHATTLRFVPALERLSSAGMSEDESDHAPSSEDERDPMDLDGSSHGRQLGPQGRRYRIMKSQWRSPEVTKWLRTMDLIYIGTKFHEDGTPMPGNQFRQRYPSNEEQIGRPVAGLPRNFYDAQWLQTLNPHAINELGVQPEVDINFTRNERSYAARFIAKKGNLQKDRVASHAEADPREVSQWVLTGTGFWGTTHAVEPQDSSVHDL